MTRHRIARGNSSTLRFESLEERRLLANTYNVTNTNANGSGSLSAALVSAAAGSSPGPDIIVFKSSVAGAVFPQTTISTPVLLKTDSGVANVEFAGLTFSNFAMPSSSVTDEVGVRNVTIRSASVGINLINITPSSVSTGDSAPFIINNVDMLYNVNGIRLQNADVPFKIEENVIVGTGGSLTGVGIDIQSTSRSILPSIIGNYDATSSGTVWPTGTGNLISAYGTAVAVAGEFPALRVSGNRLGPYDIYGFNGNGVIVSNTSGLDSVPLKQLDRIDHNTIDQSIATGISITKADSIKIDQNTISRSGGKGIVLSQRSGDHLIESNTFELNGNDAIAVQGGILAGDWARSIRISQNQFLQMSSISGALPIDLNDDGATANDEDDNDEGVNNLQNFPVFEQEGMYLQGSTWRVPVQLDSLAQGTYRLQFYKYNPTLRSYTFLKEQSIFKSGGSVSYRGEVTFTNGSQIVAGDRLAALVIDEAGSSAVPGSLPGSTSEMSPITTVGQFLPRVTDVLLSGSSWTALQPYSYKTRIETQGAQLKPIFTQNVDTITIKFNEHVRARAGSGTIGDITGDVLELRGGLGNDIVPWTNFEYDSRTFTAKWTFSTPLVDGKYAIHLKSASAQSGGIVDAAGNWLDGDWDNDASGTPDDGIDPARQFKVGDGNAGSLNNKFRFHFALLAGDYDGDGLVEHAGESAVGNGDGDADSGDSVDKAIGVLGRRLPLQRIAGADFNDDEIVDVFDLIIWRSGFGGNGAGNANGDGIVDGADFLAWQRAYGTFSAWYEGPLGVTAPAIIGAAPRVMNVLISGSQSLHPTFSFDTVDGSGNQIKTVPVGGADTVSIVFSENVNIAADCLFIVGLQTGNVPQLAQFTYDAVTFTATWRFEGWALGDQYLLSLADSITDTDDGNWLDGDWINPGAIATVNSAVSEFPSGDGVAGGWFNFVMTLLPGDANLDGRVYIDDYQIAANNWGPATLQRLFTQADFNGDNAVNDDDLDLLFGNWQRNLQNLWLLADLDSDDDVDVDDLAIIRLNANMTGATWANGDLDGDGVVDEDDLDIAYAQFGRLVNFVV